MYLSLFTIPRRALKVENRSGETLISRYTHSTLSVTVNTPDYSLLCLHVVSAVDVPEMLLGGWVEKLYKNVINICNNT